MSDKKYLYGFAVQGIQNFIFQTNKLKDIVGASELVERICGNLFKKVLDRSGGGEKCVAESLEKDPECVLAAAGNVKYVFDSKEKCEYVVRNFPKEVVENVPGVTISQAVVVMEERDGFQDSVLRLEEKIRAQRNRPMRSLLLGMTGIRRSRETGLPAVWSEKQTEFMDCATREKRKAAQESQDSKLCRAMFGSAVSPKCFPHDLKDITGDNNWIAVIHADGNGLGQVVQKLGSNRECFKKFSQKLDEATKDAARDAFLEVQEKWKLKETEVVPIRPIVLGGDDLTVICRGCLAMDYVEAFLRKFEEYTGGEQGLGRILRDYDKMNPENPVFGTREHHLTACAGVAFIKVNYPFYYGYDLAEALCAAAKKTAKEEYRVKENNGLPKSCVMFHKVQDSFVESYEDIKSRELTAADNISFCYGPYFLKGKEMEGYWTIDKLQKQVRYLEENDREKNAIKSVLRRWLTNVHDSFEFAEQQKENTRRNMGDEDRKYIDDVLTSRSEGERKIFPVYDVLALLSVSQKIIKEK